MNNQLVRTFVFETDEDVQRFMVYMRAYRKPMAEQGRFLQVVVSEYKETRSAAANRYMWAALLQPIAEQAVVGGRHYSAEVWSEFFKAQFLPDITSRGTQKWLYLPDGSRQLVGSTTHLNKDEMTDYLDKVADYAVHELNVQLPANPSEYDFGEAETRSSRRTAKEQP